MKILKKLAALSFAGVMSAAIIACTNDTPTSIGDGGIEFSQHRIITIGSWWREYYDSGDEGLNAWADWTNAQIYPEDEEALVEEKSTIQNICHLKWNKVETIEEKYDCEFYWQNLTYIGTSESLETSVLEGEPDCDIYMIDTTMAVPAQTNGLLVDCKPYLTEEMLTVFSYLDLGDGQACILKENGGMGNTYPLGFNVQMLEKNGLEDPRDLYERGEWTWDKFLEYCEVLTQDMDGDGIYDQYGYCGFVNDTFSQLLMSNGASVAGGRTETLSSPETGEVLQMLQDMYDTYNICYPYDSFGGGGNPSDSMRFQYNDGNIGFFPIAVWIQDQSGNYPMDNDGVGNLDWDIAYVQWPIGPSGSKESNACSNSVEGAFFVIPKGVEDPEIVLNFLYDLYNWYDGDTSLRDNPATANWWYNSTADTDELRAANFEVQNYCLNHPGLEMWDTLGTNMDLETLVLGQMTVQEFQDEYSGEIQEALDSTFGN